MNGVRNEVTRFFISILQKAFPFVPVRQAKLPIPATNELNIIVDLMGERSIGNEVIFDVDDETNTVAGIVEATLNVKALGDGAVEMLSMLKYYVEQPAFVDFCYSVDVAVNEVMQVQDLSMTLDGRTWQEQASVDLTISYSRELVLQGAEWFNKVYITGKTSNGKDKEKKPTDDVIIDVQISGELVN